MRLIVEGIGLNWSIQLRIIKDDPVLGSTMVNLSTVGNDGKQREMICIQLTYLNGWLFRINAGRYKKDDPRRDVIIMYQKECFVALYDYWNKGVVNNPRYYESEPRNEKPFLTADIVREAVGIANAFGFTGNQGKLSANSMIRNLYGIDCLDLMGQKALICEKQEHRLTPTEIGKIPGGISARKVNQKLAEAGIIKSYKDANNRPRWKATEKG